MDDDSEEEIRVGRSEGALILFQGSDCIVIGYDAASRLIGRLQGFLRDAGE